MRNVTSCTCSPDMSPLDFTLFPKLKEPMRGLFPPLEELSTNVTQAIRHKNKSGILHEIILLPKCWESVI